MNAFLRCAWAFFCRDAQLAVSYPIAFLMGLGGTISRTVILWLPAQLVSGTTLFDNHGGFIPYAVVGSSMMGFFMASYGGFASSVRAEQGMGTLESVMMTPASLPALILGSCSWTMTQAILDAGLMLLAAVLFFDLKLTGSVFGALTVIILTNITFMAVGLYSAAFTLVFKRGDPFRILIAGASFLLGGVMYPTDVLPSWLQVLGELLPITHGARALRAVVLQGQSLFENSSDVLILLAFAVTTLPLGVFVFQKAIFKAKQDGTLLQY